MNRKPSNRSGAHTAKNIGRRAADINDTSAYTEKLAENMGYAPKPPKKNHRRTYLIIAIVVAAILLIAVLAVVGFKLWSRAPETEDTGLKVYETPAPTAVPVEAPTVTPEPTSTPEPTPQVKRLDDVYTMLVVGRDRVGMNTDTILVARMDCRNHSVNVVSIPRDTLVNVPWSVKKVNSIYGATDINGLVDGVEDLLGFDVDNYVVVNTFVFQQVIDCIGGVYFDVPYYMDYDDPEQDLYIHIGAGYQLLNGYQAEQVVRYRQSNDGGGYANGDLGRIETQQAFFKALASQILSFGNISNLPQIIELVLQYTETDLTSANIAFYAEQFLKADMSNIHFYTVPTDTVYIYGGSYVSIRLNEWIDMINTVLNPFDADVSEKNLDVITWVEPDGIYSTTGNPPSIDSFYSYW